VTIVILTMGTHGDVRPYVALARGLKAEGYEVCIGAPRNFEKFVTGHGLAFGSIGDDFEQILKSPEVVKSLQGNLLWSLPKLIKRFKPGFINSLNQAWQLARNAKLIIIHPKCLFGLDIAEKLDIPVISSAFQPLTPTAEFPLFLTTRNYGRILNRASYNLLHAYSLIYGGLINDFRTKVLGLPKRSRFKHPLLSQGTPIMSLNAWSVHVTPKPQDWPANAHVTGYWFLDDPAAKLGSQIDSFLANGEAPLYIGFGSMAWDNENSTAKIISALKLWGGRAIVARGWGGLDDIDADNVLTITEAPHNLLLSRTSAVVHHGGAGSTAAGLRAGRPTLICPFIADQPYWGQRIAKLGAGPSPARLHKTSADHLARLFDDLCSTARYRSNATELAGKIAGEKGISAAVKLIRAT